MSWMPIVGCLLSFLSIVTLIGGVVVFVRQRRNLSTRTPTAGKVLSLETRSASFSDHTGGMMYYPVIEYKSSSGQVFQFESDFGSMPAAYRVGQQVKVLYDPSNPGKAEIDSATSRYLLPGILVFFCLVLGCIGGSFLIFGLLAMSTQ